VRVWNVVDKSMISAVNVQQNVTSVYYSFDGKKLAAGTESGEILILDAETLKTERKLKDRSVKIDDVKFSKDGRFLAAGTHDNFIDIYHIEQDYKKIGSCKGHSAHITHLDWSDDSKVIQSDSGSYEHLFWDVEDIAQITKSTTVRDLKWTDWTCIFGWYVKGIWPKGADGTDVNALHRSHDSSLLATADDSGLVKLFRFPVDIGAESKEYSGHSAHVSNVRWTINDTHVISTGGNDRTIFQWKLIGGKGEVVPAEGSGKQRLIRVGSELPSDNEDHPKVETPEKTRHGKSAEEKVLHDLVQQQLISEEKVKALVDILNDRRREKILSVLAKLKKDPKATKEAAKELDSLV